MTESRTVGRPVSPEHVARYVGCSGATVRRWESDLLAPDEEEIGRISEICHLSPLQRAFLSSAFSRAHALPPPPDQDFRAFMTRELAVSYPARSRSTTGATLFFPAVSSFRRSTRSWCSFPIMSRRGRWPGRSKPPDPR